MFTNAHANCGTKVSQKSMIPANSDKCHPRKCIDLLLDKITTLIKWVVKRKNCLPTISVSTLASSSLKEHRKFCSTNHLDILETQSHPCILKRRVS